MTIRLPQDVETSINAEVTRGHFASADDAVAEIVRRYFQHKRQSELQQHAASQQAPATAHKPIWEELQEISAKVPAEVWDALPTDLSAEHDHYIYGTPKRNDA
jgi:Arc/MetJ-type ribon-helix-helix transcriptional regulator